MIYYLVTTGFSHTMRTFLDHWGGDMEGRIRIVTYDEALRATTLPLGTYIFSDIERLLPAETEIATRVWDQLHAAGARLLNHPTRTLRRYDLLTLLHAKGRNRFRVAHAGERGANLTYPVFLREEAEHKGSITNLLKNKRELDDALFGALVRGHRLNGLLVVEYLDTADADGVFRKYSAFMVGGRVVPCHIDCSKGWIVKDTDIVDASVMAQERQYLETNPHRAWLEETFAMAGVDYGRIDYSLLNGEPQVWEINTNPIVILHPDNYTEIHMPVKQVFAGRIRPALAAIDSAVSDQTVKIDVPVPMLTRLDFEKRRQRWALAHRSLVRKAKKSAPFRIARNLAKPILSPLYPFVARLGRRSNTK